MRPEGPNAAEVRGLGGNVATFQIEIDSMNSAPRLRALTCTMDCRGCGRPQSFGMTSQPCPHCNLERELPTNFWNDFFASAETLSARAYHGGGERHGFRVLLTDDEPPCPTCTGRLELNSQGDTLTCDRCRAQVPVRSSPQDVLHPRKCLVLGIYADPKRWPARFWVAIPGDALQASAFPSFLGSSSWLTPSRRLSLGFTVAAMLVGMIGPLLLLAARSDPDSSEVLPAQRTAMIGIIAACVLLVTAGQVVRMVGERCARSSKT